MNHALPELKRLLLKRLETAKNQRMTVSQLKLFAKDAKRLGVDATHVTAERDELVGLGLIAATKTGRALSYTLTPAGAEALRQLPPAPTGYDEHLLPYQKSYLLLQLLGLDDRTGTFAKLCKTLNAKGVKESLGFNQAGTGKRVLVNQPLAGWILDSLAHQGEVTRTEDGGKASYALTEKGEELLGASEQYPTLEFRLTGLELTNLMATARLARGKMAESGAPRGALTPEHVLAEFERLKRERYAQHGMVPIYELRQAVAQQFGSAAAGHESLDGLLRDLRRDRRIRLVAIGNAGDATSQQLADSIRGENETYFMIESAHESVPVG